MNNKLLVDKNGNPTFEKLYNALLQRVSLKTMSLADIQTYCIMKSRYDFFKSNNDKAVLKDNVENLSKRCHLGRKAMYNALDKLIELGLITDLTPELRNRPHCYVVHDWEHRDDLLTEPSVDEDRSDFFIWDDNSTVPKELPTVPKELPTMPKGTTDSSKRHMSKTDSNTDYYTDSKTVEKESEETVEDNENMTPPLESFSTVSTYSVQDKYAVDPEKERAFKDRIEQERAQKLYEEENIVPF